MHCVNTIDVFVIIDFYLHEMIFMAFEEYRIVSNAFVAYCSSKKRLDPTHNRASLRRRRISS